MAVSAQSVKNRLKRLFSGQHFINNLAVSDDVASLFIPRRSNIESEKSTGDTAGWYDHILDPAPIEAARTLSQGQYDLLFTGDWFETAPPFVKDQGQAGPGDRVDKTYAEVGRRMREVIEGSNFKLESQEFLADRSTVHTAAFLVEADEEEVIYLYNLVPGKYAIAEDHKKRVDTLARKLPLTARQIKQKFNRSNDRIPEKVSKAINADKPDQMFEVQQLIEPRDPDMVREGSEDPREMPYASYYILGDEMIRHGGYHEKPFMVSRFDRWGDSPYGTGPAHIELARARSLQKMRQSFIALGDRVTNPGVFLLEGHEGDVDPFGITYITEQEAALGLPREWQTNIKYDVAVDMLDRETKILEETFFVPLFKLLMSDTDREKTAFEVQKMLEEQVGRAAPTFSRLDEEVIVPFLKRVFNIMLRADRFVDIEDDMQAVDSEGLAGVAEPSINFTSKLAQAMKAVRSNTVIQFLNSLGFVFELKPEVLDNTDWNKTYRRMWKDAGNPVDELRSEKKVAEEQQAGRDAALAQQLAATAKDAGAANKATRG